MTVRSILVGVALMGALAIGHRAVAGEDDGKTGQGLKVVKKKGSSDADDDELDEGDTISGARPRAIRDDADGQYVSDFAKELVQYEGQRYEPIVYHGAKVLSTEPEFVHDCRVGLELVFLRDYKGAKKHFDQLGTRWRGRGIGPVGQVVVWQALMLENFDFRYEAQYRSAYKATRQELEEALMVPGNEVWERFIMGAALGVDAIHTMRHEEYLSALNSGYEAMKSINRARKLAPDFVDAELGDGLFNYWSSVISMSSKAIPDLPDKRLEGIQQMSKVEREGIFLSAPATLGLIFTWIEEGKRKTALRAAQRNNEKYPNNVINNLVYGRIQMYNRLYKESEATYSHVIKTAPENMRVHFYLGRLYFRWNKMAKSRASLETYVAFDDLSAHDRAVGLYYIGNTWYRAKDYDKAEDYYKQAWKLDRLKRAQTRLDAIKRKRESGQAG